MKRARNVHFTDKRGPMLRLLVDGQCRDLGDPTATAINVNYHEQHRTLWKAQRLGYVTNDSNQHLTEAGRAFIANATKETA